MSDAEAVPTATQDEELAAIQSIITSLAGLDATARERVLEYVFRRLDIARSVAPRPNLPSPVPPQYAALAPIAPVAPVAAGHLISDVRSFANSKRPGNDTERVAVIAYFLSEVATGADKRATINAEDVAKYFKQAGFPLPARSRQTLFNAKSAGYLDAAAETGAYKLNPVGHNLVVHGLPAIDAVATKPKGKKKPAKR